MQDTELYQQLLGLVEPWYIEKVELSIEKREIYVQVKHPAGQRFRCPECNQDCSVYDHQERLWRHLDSCQFKTYLCCDVPRIQCRQHGVKQVRLPWAETGSSFTAMFERFVIDLLKACSKKDAAELLDLSWDQVDTIMRRAVQRGLERKTATPLPKLGVDEKAFRKGHHYLTIVVNAETGAVEYIGQDRTKASLDGFFQSISQQQRESIETIAMDMWEPYRQSVVEHIPDAEEKIVLDRFHIMKHVSEAVDKVRRQEHRELRKSGESVLTNTKYLWLYAAENLPEDRREEFHTLQQLNLRVSKAWAIKEQLRSLWNYRYMANAFKFFRRWYYWATHSRLQPIIKVAKMFLKHSKFILNYIKHRLTNAVAEGTNSKIQEIKKRACGFRNIDNFTTAILFHCGKLNLYPH
jgi:transposase